MMKRRAPSKNDKSAKKLCINDKVGEAAPQVAEVASKPIETPENWQLLRVKQQLHVSIVEVLRLIAYARKQCGDTSYDISMNTFMHHWLLCMRDNTKKTNIGLLKDAFPHVGTEYSTIKLRELLMQPDLTLARLKNLETISDDTIKSKIQTQILSIKDAVTRVMSLVEEAVERNNLSEFFQVLPHESVIRVFCDKYPIDMKPMSVHWVDMTLANRKIRQPRKKKVTPTPPMPPKPPTMDDVNELDEETPSKKPVVEPTKEKELDIVAYLKDHKCDPHKVDRYLKTLSTEEVKRLEQTANTIDLHILRHSLDVERCRDKAEAILYFAKFDGRL